MEVAGYGEKAEQKLLKKENVHSLYNTFLYRKSNMKLLCCEDKLVTPTLL
jgi:hypothetical protein